MYHIIHRKVTCMGKQKINLKDSSEFSGVLGCFYPSFIPLFVALMEESAKLPDKPESFLHCFLRYPVLPLRTCQLIKFYSDWFTQIARVNRFDEIFLYGWYNLLRTYPSILMYAYLVW